MAFNINSFKKNAIDQGGFRPTMFEVNIAYVGEPIKFLCNATNVPALTMGVIEVPYFGRKIKIPGDRTFAEWTTTIFIEENFQTRDAIEQWNAVLNDPLSNVRFAASEADYKMNADVILYNKQGSPIRTYTLYDMWPQDVGTIELDWNTTDTLATYQVTWAFDWMMPGKAGGPGGILQSIFQ